MAARLGRPTGSWTLNQRPDRPGSVVVFILASIVAVVILHALDTTAHNVEHGTVSTMSAVLTGLIFILITAACGSTAYLVYLGLARLLRRLSTKG